PIQAIWFWTGVLGLGIGATFPQVNLALQNAVPMADVGAATAGRLFFVQLSQTVGATVFGALLAAQLTATLVADLKPLAQALPAPAAAYLQPYRLRDGGERVTTALAQLDAELARERFSGRRQVSLQAQIIVRRAFADAVATIFGYALPVAGLAVVLGLLLPELPLRRSNASPSPATVSKT
ncbi:MAG: MFS transporter, partial [Gemmatimonadaceae bacterium]|nr:MFS transporter [Gloeobacterales cyanobacterium ES-bin-141]